jgi:SNF2 family DNA or RNA helicase
MQGPAVSALAYALRRLGSALVVGEQGCGKTFISLAAAYSAGCRRLLVLCPPHLAGKWAREARLTIPGVAAIVCRRPSDLEKARELARRGRPVVCVLPREHAKLHYERETESWSRLLVAVDTFTGRFRLSRGATGMPSRHAACPRCGCYLEKDKKGQWKSRCEACGEVLRACRSGRGPRRYALAEYIRRRMRSCFDCLVIDEAHEYRSADSLQAEAAMTLARTIPRLVCLTGTLLGGYASHLYNVLYMLSPTFRREFDLREKGRSRFVKEYGLRVVERRPWQRKATSRPKPGVSPAVTPWLLERGVYLRLDEVVELPPLSEEALLVEPGEELGEAIRRLHQRARSRLQEMTGASRATAALMHTLISYPDLAWAGEELMDPQSGELLVRYAPLAVGILPKEQELVSLVSREVAEGRPCLVYVTYTGTRDITGRLQKLLEEQGIRTDVLRAEEVPPARREGWLMERMARGVQALICQPRLVALGLDLVTFPTVVFYQPDPDPFVLRQAARRSYRIGQSQPVRVYYMAYRESAQELLLSLLAKKTAASLLLEGEALGGGLLPVSQEETLLELARLVREGGAEDAREAIRQQAAIARWSDSRPGWEGKVERPQVLSNLGLQLALPGL